MAGPDKNYGTLSGISKMLIREVPAVVTINPSLKAFPSLYIKTYSFYRYGLINFTTNYNITPKVKVTVSRIPQSPLMTLFLVTFPSTYKTRSGRARPIKGQLWPRTR